MENSTSQFVSNVVLTPKKPEETRKLYSEWADKYDQDCASLGYKGGDWLVKFFIGLDVPKGSRILDVGAGTGKIGVILRDYDYKNIDALDGCLEMLEIAKKKNCYKRIYQSLVTQDIVLPLDVKSYDVAIMAGVLCPGHIMPTAFGQIIRLVKKGKKLTNAININDYAIY